MLSSPFLGKLKVSASICVFSPLEASVSLNTTVFTNGQFYLLSTIMFFIFLCDYNTAVLRVLTKNFYENVVVLFSVHKVLVHSYLPAGISTFLILVASILTGNLLFNINNIREFIIIYFLLFLCFFLSINVMTVYCRPFSFHYCNFLRSTQLRMLPGVGAAVNDEPGAAAQPAAGPQPGDNPDPASALQLQVNLEGRPNPGAGRGLAAYDREVAAIIGEHTEWQVGAIARRLLFPSMAPGRNQAAVGVVQPPIVIVRGPKGSASPEFIAGVGPRPATPLVHGPQVRGSANNEFFHNYNNKLYAASLKENRQPFLDPVEEFNFTEYLGFVARGNASADFRPSQYYCVTRRSDGSKVRVFVVERPRIIEGHPELNVGVIQDAGCPSVVDPHFRPSVTAVDGVFLSHHPVGQLKNLVHRPSLAAVEPLQDFGQPGGGHQSWWEWFLNLFG